ncbi:MAG: protein phosphatase 2C domain-containing protein [candidate division Zixibacteria bacterium]|nr:protein phosphatase 2C domain-containing protein [candidate division Zixibacteria bacterium]
MNMKISQNGGMVSRFRLGEPPTPEEFLEIITNGRNSNHATDDKPHVSGAPWNIGFATAKGNVRSDNQDYGVAFNHKGYQILLIADGIGGLTHGKYASYIATFESSQVILRGLEARMTANEIQELSKRAVFEAGLQLSAIGDKLNVLTTGLRTTLIIVIANKSHAVLTYIGDGGVYHYKSPAHCEAVLIPHKAVPGNLNLISSSLGPTPHGNLRTRIIQRTESDLIIAMTDGIADRIVCEAPSMIPPEFIEQLVSMIHANQGDLQSVSYEAVKMLAVQKDKQGYICNDNVSLGIIGNQCSTSGTAESPASIHTELGVEDAPPALPLYAHHH